MNTIEFFRSASAAETFPLSSLNLLENTWRFLRRFIDSEFVWFQALNTEIFRPVTQASTTSVNQQKFSI